MTASPRPRRLKVLDDGKMELPLADTVGEDGTRTPGETVVLTDSPSMEDLAVLQDIVIASDERLKDLTAELPEIPATLAVKLDTRGRVREGMELTVEEHELIAKRSEVLKDRTRVTYSPDSPHAKGLLDVVSLLTGKTYTRKDLPGWAGHWSVLGEVYARYMDPFAGRAAAMAEEALAALDATTGSGS